MILVVREPINIKHFFRSKDHYMQYGVIKWKHFPYNWPFVRGFPSTWWRHQMETFTALLAICAGNSPVPGEFPTQRPLTRNFDVFFDLHPTRLLSKLMWGWRFETPLHPLWRHGNEKGQWRGALMFSLICAWKKQLNKQSGRRLFETPSRPLWRHCNDCLKLQFLSL